MDIKGTVGMGSEGTRNMLLEIGGKEILFYVVAESLGELCPAVMWKAELVTD